MGESMMGTVYRDYRDYTTDDGLQCGVGYYQSTGVVMARVTCEYHTGTPCTSHFMCIMPMYIALRTSHFVHRTSYIALRGNSLYSDLI